MSKSYVNKVQCNHNKMDELLNCISELCEITDVRKAHPNQIYRLLSELDVKNEQKDTFVKEILPKLYDLIEAGKVKKDILFLSTLCNVDILNELLRRESEQCELKIDPVSIFDYCYYKRKHWFLEIINNANIDVAFSNEIHDKIALLRLFTVTNESDIDVDTIERLLHIQADYKDPFVEIYFDATKHALQILKFVKILKPNVEYSEIYHFLTNHDVLQTFSEYLDLDDSKNWHLILEKIVEAQKYEDNFPSKEKTNMVDNFTAYAIITSVMNCLKFSKNPTWKDEITGIIEKVKSRFFELKDGVVQMDVLEDVFALTFLRTGGETDAFFCDEAEVRLILSFLRSVFEEIRKRNIFVGISDEFKRFLQLNKYVLDAFWRLELISEVKDCTKREFLHFMLAPPNSLINLCLKKNNVEKADQVIRIFDLENSQIAAEINYSISYEILKEDVRKLLQTPSSKHEDELQRVIDDHFSRSISSSHSNELNQKSIDLFDLFLTLPRSEAHRLLLVQSDTLPEMSLNFEKFHKRILDIFHDTHKSVNDILAEPSISLNFDEYKNNKTQYETLAEIYDKFNQQIKTDEPGTLNLNHVAHKTLTQMQEIFKTDDNQVRYMQRLLNYLKMFAKLLFVEQNNSDLVAGGRNVSLFEILKIERSQLIGDLIYHKGLDGTDFDAIFTKLKLDLIYHMAACSFPKITLNFTTFENAQNSYKPRKDVVNYIHKRNWLLAFILNKIHDVDDVKIDVNDFRVKTFCNLLKLEDIGNLKPLFNNNEAMTVLHLDYASKHVLRCFGSQEIDDKSIVRNEFGEVDWKLLYELISSVPDNQALGNEQMIVLRDWVLCNLITKSAVGDRYKYVHLIVNNELRVKTLLEEFKKWPGEFCLDVLKSELTRFETLDQTIENALRDWCKKIELYEQLKDLYEEATWSEIDEKCTNDLGKVMQDIMKTKNIEILIKFINVHQPDEELLSNVNVQYFLTIFNGNGHTSDIKALLNKLPESHAQQICENLLRRLKNLNHLKFTVDYMLKSVKKDTALRNVQITLKMLACFPTSEQDQLWSLIEDPLGIIEVLLMNTKLDKLGQILNAIRPDLERNEFDENELSVDMIDALLRMYAEKSLDFKIISHAARMITPDNKIMVSIDSLSLDHGTFVMPQRVPTKDEWISDNDVVECMCCHQITFSMFNRRHHCRRCGRVVCWNCSLKRMQVESYGDILVRVCIDCFEQTGGDMSSKSIVDEFWILTEDPVHNAIIREEFSYENAPSITLCLSILKYHSKTEDYPKFLLNQCDNILKLLQPVTSDYTVEIDYNLIIKMLRSLAVAAKMTSNQCMLQCGTSLADKILSQAELLGLLSEKNCLYLIPRSKKSQSPYLDAGVLRRIRDKLLNQEQWNLALEVSTKAGLDNTGVFAIWGKSCLRAGNLQSAREKFQRCFDKTTTLYETFEFSSTLDTSTDTDKSYHHSRLSVAMPENKPSKNPPPLNEIIQILESTTMPIDQKIFKDFQAAKTSRSNLNISPQSELSICILNKLKNLNAIAVGNYSCGESSFDGRIHRPHLDKVFYEECIFYLDKYGTHASLYQFYIKHGAFREALEYIIHNHLNPDIFIDIYLTCLNDGLVDVLQENMVKIDSTFDLLEDYIKSLCIHLEKQSMLNSLYELQQFIGDFIRAAMTCIKFYSYDVSSFEELSNRVKYLHKARQHLIQELEQEQWVDVTSVDVLSSNAREVYEEKSITNPALVMKLSSKDIDKHINTIVRQIEVVKFLADCEKAGRPVSNLLPDIVLVSKDQSSKSNAGQSLPTLFGSLYEKMQLAILTIVCGENVADGFGVAYRIIQDYKLKATKVFCQAGKQLAKAKKYSSIPQLVNCIRSSGENVAVVTEICDEMLVLAARTLGDDSATDQQLEDIIKNISNRAIKINSYIETKQLRSAFLVAAKAYRFGDIRRICREAELLNRPDVKRLCQKYLQTHPHTSPPRNEHN